MKIYFKILIISLFVFVSCENDTLDYCLSNQQSVQVEFYSWYTSDDEDNDTTLSDLYVYSPGIDSVIYDTVDVDNVYLPLSMMSDTSVFVLDIKTFKDTLKFIHQKELNFVSRDCGYVFNFYLDKVEFTDRFFIDTAYIVDKDILYNDESTNVKVYIY